MTNKQKMIALVGYGNWGKKIASTLLVDHGSVFICEPKVVELPDSLKKVSWEDLLKNQEIEHVFLATPEETHFQLAKELLQHGKNVFVEKPLTLKKNEAQELCELARKKYKVLYCDYIFLFDSFAQKIKALLDLNAIGTLKEVHSYRYSVDCVKPLIHVSDDLLIHDLYLGEFFYGQKVSSAVISNPVIKNFQILSARFDLHFSEHKKLLSFDSWIESTVKRELIIWGEGGIITWKKGISSNDELYLEVGDFKERVLVEGSPSSLEKSIHSFLMDCVQEGQDQKEIRFESYIRHSEILEKIAHMRESSD